VRPFSFQGPMTPLHAAVILARYRARQLIRRQIKAEDHFRHRTLPAAVLNRLASDLVEQCPSLVAAALDDPIVVQMTAPKRRGRKTNCPI
jgi:hypothetical protein